MSLYKPFVFDYENKAILLQDGEIIIPVWEFSEKVNIPCINNGIFKHRQCIVKTNSAKKISIVWGSGTYSDNHKHIVDLSKPFIESPYRVEMMVLNAGYIGNFDEGVCYQLDSDLINLINNLGGIEYGYGVQRSHETYEL